jgi:hypothetical protein
MGTANLPPRVAEALARVRDHGRAVRRRAVLLLLDQPGRPRGEQINDLTRLAEEQHLEVVSITSEAAMALQLVHDRTVRVVVMRELDGAYRQLVQAAGGETVSLIPAGRIRPVARPEVGTIPQQDQDAPGRPRIQPVPRDR